MFTEYPRPQLKRQSFFSLNGEWLLQGQKITVPYPPQSTLANYTGEISCMMDYQKTFTLSQDFVSEIEKGKHVLLHFGAVDQIAQVVLDGHFLGTHEGGYLPFSFDITESLSTDINHTLTVRVIDTLSTLYPYGKQCEKSHGMWYTQVSGIWQTVWLETVNKEHISSLKMLPQVQKEKQSLEISFTTENITDFSEYSAEIEIPSPAGKIISKKIQLSSKAHFDFESELGFENWTCENPKLYDFSVKLFRGKNEIDQVESYFALRSITIENENCIPYFALNGQKIFLNAVLDQGYYPQGIFLGESEQDFLTDILNMKNLGFNTLRKHIKVEPECFYYYCDKYGMLVMQDMVQSGKYNFWRDTAFPSLFNKKGNENQIGKEGSTQPQSSLRKDFFVNHSLETIAHLYNHPCIIYWTIFNEGWGQFSTNELYTLVKNSDSSRIVDSASGWFFGAKSDVQSEHIYFKAKKLDKILANCKKQNLPLVVSECGGFKLNIPGHTSASGVSYGYGECKTQSELTAKIRDMHAKMIEPYKDKGLCGFVYTQISDVENEINGLYTYDRKVKKVDCDKLTFL